MNYAEASIEHSSATGEQLKKEKKRLMLLESELHTKTKFH